MIKTREERLAEQLARDKASGVLIEPGAPRGAATLEKRQTAGATAVLSESVQMAKVKRARDIDIRALFVRDGYGRSAGEFAGPEFEDLKASIAATNGNLVPIIVRPVPVNGEMKYEIIAGQRRYEACKALGRATVLADERDLSDADADVLHDIENAKRTDKRPYSQALTFIQMMASGRYATQAALAEALGRTPGPVSQRISLIEKAPAGMWERVVDPETVKDADGRVLLKAYSQPEFLKALKHAGKQIKVAELLRWAKAKKDADAGKTVADRIAEKQRGKDFHLVLPGELPAEVRAKIREFARKLASEL